MRPIAEMLATALREKGWSISGGAAACGVDRSFLSRLVGGYPPPRTKRDRLLADEDERYKRLAKGLGFDPPELLIKAAVREQTVAVPDKDAKERAESFRKAVWDLVKREIDQLNPSYRTPVSQLLRNYVESTMVRDGVELQREALFEDLEPVPVRDPGSEIPGFGAFGGHEAPPREHPAGSGYGGDIAGATDESRSSLARLLTRIGDLVYEYDGAARCDAQADVGELFWDLATRKLTHPQEAVEAAKKALEVAEAKAG